MYNYPKIKFGEKEFYVVDKFEYEGVTYLYIYEDVYVEGMDIDIEDFDGDIEINFIHKMPDGKFENIVDDELFNKLMVEASKRLLTGQNPYMKNMEV